MFPLIKEKEVWI